MHVGRCSSISGANKNKHQGKETKVPEVQGVHWSDCSCHTAPSWNVTRPLLWFIQLSEHCDLTGKCLWIVLQMPNKMQHIHRETTKQWLLQLYDQEHRSCSGYYIFSQILCWMPQTYFSILCVIFNCGFNAKSCVFVSVFCLMTLDESPAVRPHLLLIPAGSLEKLLTKTEEHRREDKVWSQTLWTDVLLWNNDALHRETGMMPQHVERPSKAWWI